MSNKIKKGCRYILTRMREFRLCMLEFSRGGKLKNNAYKGFVDSGMLISAHSVEKGLGLRNVQPGHSGQVVDALLDRLLSLCNDKNRIAQFAFRETLRVVIAYMDFQKQFDTSQFQMYPVIKKKYTTLCERLGDDYMNHLRKELKAGASFYSKEQLIPVAGVDFEEFVISRHSIRTYEQKPIETDVIRKAVELANRSPSACNRQASYVYFCSRQELVAEVDQLITGSAGFKGEVPNYLIVTTDRSYFSQEEQFQWYINGGIYLSYLSLALHSQGIGHCLMQWKAFHKTEKSLKNIMGISKTEAIIAVIGCGYYPDQVRCIDSQRKEVKDTLRIV